MINGGLVFLPDAGSGEPAGESSGPVVVPDELNQSSSPPCPTAQPREQGLMNPSSLPAASGVPWQCLEVAGGVPVHQCCPGSSALPVTACQRRVLGAGAVTEQQRSRAHWGRWESSVRELRILYPSCSMGVWLQGSQLPSSAEMGREGNL